MTELPDDRLTLTEARRAANTTFAAVLSLIAAGTIEAEWDGRRWRVHPDSLPDPEPQTRVPRPIILRQGQDGWLPGSTDPGDRAPARQRPPEGPIEEAPWRIIKPPDA